MIKMSGYGMFPLYFLPIKTRIPLKFGPETTTHTTCARALVRVEDHHGRVSEGWGRRR
jgi:hypothetical protein